MKILLFTLLSLLVILKAPGDPLPLCNIATVKQALPPVIFFETTIDGLNQPVLVTRFLHNKLGIYGSESTKCYFNALDFNYISSSIGLIGLASLMIFVYKTAIKKYYWLLAPFFLLPLIPFFTNSQTILILTYKIFAIIGLGLMMF